VTSRINTERKVSNQGLGKMLAKIIPTCVEAQSNDVGGKWGGKCWMGVEDVLIRAKKWIVIRGGTMR
jgi:hypothetical protein